MDIYGVCVAFHICFYGWRRHRAKEVKVLGSLKGDNIKKKLSQTLKYMKCYITDT